VGVSCRIPAVIAALENVVSEITAQMETLRAGLERIHIPAAMTPAGSSFDKPARMLSKNIRAVHKKLLRLMKSGHIVKND
jgi:hypothetical protein